MLSLLTVLPLLLICRCYHNWHCWNINLPGTATITYSAAIYDTRSIVANTYTAKCSAATVTTATTVTTGTPAAPTAMLSNVFCWTQLILQLISGFKCFSKFYLFPLECWLFMIANKEMDFSSDILFIVRLQYHKSAVWNNGQISSTFLQLVIKLVGSSGRYFSNLPKVFSISDKMLTVYDRKERKGFHFWVFIHH